MKTAKKLWISISSLLLLSLITACSEGGDSNKTAALPVMESPAVEESVTDSTKAEMSNVKDALANYPVALISEFAVSYPEVSGSEIFKRIDFHDDPTGIVSWGIEGQSPDETLEIEAIFSRDLILVTESREVLLESLPEAIMSAFLKLYPSAEIDEITSSLERGEVAYAVLFILDGEEMEVNLDETGIFVSLENVLDQDEVPASILALVEAQGVNMEVEEYEEVTHADGSVSYVVEFENDAGESISFDISSGGKILQVELEGPIQAG